MTDSISFNIDFGTSGLRGPAIDFSAEIIFAYLSAFLNFTVSQSGKKLVFVGADLRDSSPRIAAACISAIRANGWQEIYAGNVPTPALAYSALAKNCPAIMVTGSHIPKTYNGIKFYRNDGEFLKSDEPIISSEARRIFDKKMSAKPVQLPEIDQNITRSYVNRFTKIFPKDTLEGLKIGVDLHSAVGRDLLVEILEILGAKPYPFRRSEKFIAIDTEALSDDDLKRAKSEIQKHGLDCVVSTDGDGDRPLLIDENGNQINGDVLGALCAKSLGIDIIVTPLSSTSAIEKSGWFEKVIRTKIGSPYVVAAMSDAVVTGKNVAGFEANGGFLTETDIELSGSKLTRLPTRDAVLPLIATLKTIKDKSIGLSSLAGTLPQRFMKADRVKQVENEPAQKFLYEMKSSEKFRSKFDVRLSNPIEINNIDGVRLSFADQSIVHFRQSGNAPEMRCYVETADSERTDKMLGEIIAKLEGFFS